MAKAIIVTGASRGIGYAVAEYLLKCPEGINVVAVARDHGPLQKLKERFGAQVEILSADLSDFSKASQVVNLAIAAYGRLDGLVLNHGCLEPVAKVADADVEKWKKGFDTNFFSMLNILKYAIPQLRLTRGRIIFTSSGAATSATTGWGFYGASKAAINHLAMTLGKEEPEVVTIALRPGMVDTDMQVLLRERYTEILGPKDSERFITAHKEGKLLRPEKPGNVIARLVLSAPTELSGKFLTWNGPELATFQDD
ncbi:hypothetical protein VTO42DRAFT_6917 [Malbranchea cinnamomea]